MESTKVRRPRRIFAFEPIEPRELRMKMRTFIAACVIALAALAAADRASAETEAAREYKRLSDELRAKQGTMAMNEYFMLLERSLGDFIRKYPKAPEAGEAHFALGTVYSATGSTAKAIEHTEAFMASPAVKNASMAAAAKLVLASSYLAVERFDEAEKLFRELVDAGLSIDQRISDGARSELARIDALRRIKIGSPAAGIVGTSHEGKKIDLAKYRGKVVLIDFWAAWCAPCRQEMPNVIRTYKDLKKKGFEVIGVSLDEDRAKFDKFIRDNKMDWPQIYDGKGWATAAAKSYAVNAIPATFLVDRKGVLRYRNVRGPKLREAVEALLAEK